MRTKQIGGLYRFTYPGYGTPNTHPEYTDHSGKLCRIVRQLTSEECDPEYQPLWRIKFELDGWVATACSSELRKVKEIAPMRVISNRRLGRKGQKTIGIRSLR